MAAANPLITADAVEATEFMDLSRKYHVTGVPKTIVNETIEIMGALHALNVRSPFPLGNEKHQATHCLMIEIRDRCLWVARINDAKQYMNQYPITNLLVFPRPGKGVLTRPCTCFYGWKFENDEYCLCDVCNGSEVVLVEAGM